MVVLLTGYRGLAAHLIESLSEYSLSVLVRNEKALPELREKFPKVFFEVGDVSRREDCDRWFESTVSHFGSADVLINNAAVTGPGGRLDEIGMADFEKATQINLFAPLYLTQLLLKYRKRRALSQGIVINLSGGGAASARPFFSSYAAAKCALVRMTETLAVEYPEHRFYAISPGGLKTPMIEAVLQMDRSRIGKEFEEAQRRMETGGESPQHAVDLILWLLKNVPQTLSGRMINAVKDNYKERQNASPNWWTLRRVDEVLF